MKKIVLIILFIASSFWGYAQKIDSLKNSIQKKVETIAHGGINELKYNLLSTIEGLPELTYERIIADNMGVGVAIAVGLDNSAAYEFGFTPYYRLYFGKKEASGLFIEGNTSIITLTDDYYAISPQYPNGHTYKSRATSVGLGAAAGVKFLTRNSFFIEAYIGFSKLIGDRIGYYTGAVPRNGISIGKRF